MTPKIAFQSQFISSNCFLPDKVMLELIRKSWMPFRSSLMVHLWPGFTDSGIRLDRLLRVRDYSWPLESIPHTTGRHLSSHICAYSSDRSILANSLTIKVWISTTCVYAAICSSATVSEYCRYLALLIRVFSRGGFHRIVFAASCLRLWNCGGSVRPPTSYMFD